MTVTDTATNTRHTYSNPQGTAFQTIADTTTFAGCPAGAGLRAAASTSDVPPAAVIAASAPTAQPRAASVPGGCVASANALCLNGHLQVEITWQASDGSSGVGTAVSLTPESGYFWFFDPSNVELVVKALNACAIGGGQWFFAAGMTTLGVRVTVTDTFTNEQKTYGNTPSGTQPGTPFVSVLDTAAFPSCRSGPPVTYDLNFSCHEASGCNNATGSFCVVSSSSSLTVHAGDTITWSWQAGENHWIQINGGQGFGGDGPFAYSRTLTEPGSLFYECERGYTEWEVVVASITTCHPVTHHEAGTITVIP
jgi:hypothetical protein